MDPLTAAGTFATIMQLICNYRSEKGATEVLNHQKFIEWLEYHRHEEIKNHINNTAELHTEIDNLLRADHTVIMHKLDSVNVTLAKLTSRVSEFRGLTLAIVPDADLSEQSISILRQLVSKQSKYFMSIKNMRGLSLQLEKGGQVQYSEGVFLDDDLNQLVAIGLLSLRYSGDGKTAFYGITRNAARLIESIDGRSQ